MYSLGQGTSVNLERGIYWYQLAAEAGHAVAQNNLGIALMKRDPPKAMYWLLSAAEKGSPFAQKILGDVYSSQLILPEPFQSQYEDYSKALNWYREVGNRYTNRRLGEMYLAGEGDDLDVAKAIMYYTKAAEDDDETSQKFLERAYREGLPGLEADEERANYWANRRQLSEVKRLTTISRKSESIIQL